ncbi:PH domain-containing protein [Antrihabitans stalactiti]|uniref:PH domain-containing protein n=1 Tax=Antrihabitans stalactiti TaxID=2584121 RepID=A0A848KM86_9NOCA|nr:PH domain-containing protein [Antrihabitans stalactiti]NMN96867.1 PH domain-containing protein [Antrihabitans stalactiti]
MTRASHEAAAWVYQGTWQVLTRLFLVPAHPPDLPVRPGDVVERFGPAPGFLRYLKFRFWALNLLDLWIVLPWIASFFVNRWLGLALLPVVVLLLVVPDVLAYIAIHLRYDTTWYVLSERSMRIRRGIWVLREATITFENVQDVRIQQGPLQRYCGIASVIVETAGGGAKKDENPFAGHTGLIEGIEDAERIRDLIMARVRQSRAAGLGDDHHDSPTAGWKPAHIAVLREIRDELRSTSSTPPSQ